MKKVNDIADSKKAAVPVFTRFTYCGNDQVYKDNPLKPDEFYSPILQGCYPDPSIVRKGNDFFMVTSSFVMVPGVPVFHSNDLVNWRQIGHVLDKPSQLNVQDAPIREGIWAPQITYNPFNETFYMITTHKAAGLGNIVVKTQNPFNGWSDPLKLQFNGIDPSLFFDDDGKAYLVHNDTPEKALYEGHCVIKIWEYDTDADQVIAGTDKIVVDGGVDISKEPFWIEGPHIYKKNGRYYLMCAEGGTCEWHSEVIFVSNHPKGPYVPAPGNPILTQRHLPVDRSNKVDQTGHADLIQDFDGKYYGVFLAVRPNNKDRVNTGRETFILPVDWSGEFPVFENGLFPIQPKLKMPKGVNNRTCQDGFLPNGNFAFTDNFTSEKLDYRWIGVRGWREEFIDTSKDGVKINPYPVNIKEVKPTSTLFCRQQHNNFEASVIMAYKPVSSFELAGLVCYQSESFNYVFGITRKDNDDYIVLQRTERTSQGTEAQATSKVIASEKIDISNPVKLRVRAQGDDYQFSYSVDDGGYFKNLGGVVSGDILSTNVAGGFTGSLIGLYATSANDIIL
ncbi:MAG: glycoside hydrolase family 43 protein [Bacteroidales bacterium]|jgi:alpha-N-arabinofuranosidase|nr:glycoside hydrolase family 43 protein [Bacteroidales bacterium]